MSQEAVIRVVGVGGGGCNAVNRMIKAGIQGVDFVSMNTDIQALDASLANKKVQLGLTVSKGLGSGGDPEAGRASADEAKTEIRKALEGANMVFIAAGMGGGTGTGAAPIVAEVAREMGALTVGVVTKPFSFEGSKRKRAAEAGINALVGRVDTMLTIPNDRLLNVVERRTTVDEAFRVADDSLRQGVQGITDIITIAGLINVDFADVRSVMSNAGPAVMGIGHGVGEQRALQAAQIATSSAMLEQTINGARGVLVNITAGDDLTLAEVHEAMTYIQELCNEDDANIFFGNVTDSTLDGAVRVTVIATGFQAQPQVQHAVAQVSKAVPAAEPVSETSADVTTQVKDTIAQRAVERAQERAATSRGLSLDTSAVFDESDLDIPAFIREHRSRQN